MRTLLASALAVTASSACFPGTELTTPPAPTQARLVARVGADSVSAGFTYSYYSASQLLIGGRVDPPASRVVIELSLRNPRVGTFDLAESVGPVSTTSASLQLGPAGGALWMTQKSGDGTLTITRLSEGWVEGTFHFTATAANGLSSPSLQHVTGGTFSVKLCSFGAC